MRLKTNRYDQVDRNMIWNYINKNAPVMLDREIGEWTAFEYEDRRTPTLRALIDPQGHASFTLRKKRDGTVAGNMPKHLMGSHPTTWYRSIIVQLQQQATSLTTKWLIRTAPVPEIHIHIATDNVIWQAIDGEVRNALRRNINRPASNGKERLGPVRSPEGRIQRTIRENILDPDTDRDRNRWFGDCPNNNIDQYNHAFINRNTFRRMERENHHVFRYYCMAHHSPTPQRLSGPEDVTRWVREHTGLRGAAWRVFVRVGWNIPRLPGAGQDPREFQAAFTAAAEANVPGASENKLRIAVNAMIAFHIQFREAQWRNGDPWKAWVHVLNRFLTEGEDGQSSRLRDIADSLAWHIRHQQPWGPTGWPEYIERANGWNRETALRHREEEANRATNSYWESLLSETQLGDITARPVCTREELIGLGREMGNCLSTYWQRCQAGSNRIFTLWKDQELIAAGEIRKHLAGWTTGQMEKHRHKDAGEEAEQALAELARLFQQKSLNSKTSEVEKEE